MNPIESLRAAMSVSGLVFNGQFKIDDEIHHFNCPGEKGEASWYAGHERDGAIIANYGCFRRDIKATWCSTSRDKMSREEWTENSKRWKELEVRRAEDEKRKHAESKAKCEAWFAKFPKADGHMYLAVKGVPALGPLYLFTDELFDGWLAMPLQDIDGSIHSAQFVADDGTKEYCYGGRKKGCFYPVSETPGGPIIVCEGYATGASLFLATGWTVICAMDCGNLLPVCQSFRKKYPLRTIIIAADNDQFKKENAGVTKGRAAAKDISGVLAFPEFSDEALANEPTDFNDLHQAAGLDEVRSQIFSALPLVATPVGLLQLPVKNDPAELLRYRYLSRRGSLLFCGPAGQGKSSFTLQAFALWSNTLPFFDIQPTKPLKTVIIQAENDDGDLAEMRDGICKGLNFNADQRRQFFENVLILTHCGVTGKQFIQEVVRPTLDIHAPDFLCIDPMLSYIGGDSKEQKVVGPFLREYLHPELYDHECAAVLSHHTNKPPSTKDSREWRNGEFAYLGSGSAEWANYPRAVLALQSTGTPGLYTLHAGKRGARLAWSAEDGESITYQKFVAWSKDKDTIYWRAPESAELPDEVAEQAQKTTNSGRPSKYTTDALVNSLKWEGLTSVSYTEFAQAAKDKTGMPLSTFKRVLQKALDDGKIFQSALNGRYQIFQSPTQQSLDGVEG